MKNIQVCEGAWSLKSLYKEANTPSKRALVGYMIKTCKANDSIYGGALFLLRYVEAALQNNELYCLEPGSEGNKARQIIRIAEYARQGKYRKFALSKKEIKKILNHIK